VGNKILDTPIFQVNKPSRYYIGGGKKKKRPIFSSSTPTMFVDHACGRHSLVRVWQC